MKEWNDYSKAEDSWQALRMQAELIKGFDTFSELGPSICVYGSARTEPEDPWYQESEKFGKLMSLEGFNIMTGGGPGIMEAVNKGAYESGSDSKSVGVGIELPFEQGMNDYIDVGIECRYFFTRKVFYLKYSQGYVVSPGGVGTLDELFETITLAQVAHIPKFPIILLGHEYWSGLVDWIKDKVVGEGKMSEKDLDAFRIVDTAEDAVEKILKFHKNYRPDSVTNF